MTTPARNPPASPRRDLLHAGISLVVIGIASFLFMRLSLDNVAGVTRRPNGDCCNTEFVNAGWWLPMVGLIVPIWWATRSAVWAAIPAVALPTFVSFSVASTAISRYQESGWGDGLEVLAYVGSFIHGFAFGVAALIGIVSWRRRLLRRPEPMSSTHPVEGIGPS